MEESKKGVTPSVEVEKPNPSMDIHGFGKDFLTSWKLTTAEKNDLNFTDEKPQKEKKKGFDFAKLDDFELGDDFAKISSFKMDISDIDFSSPECTTHEPKEKTKGQSTPRKISSEKDDFSFNFDFNELEGFGLESNLLKVGKDSETKKVLDLSSKKEEKIDSERKPGTIDPNTMVISKKSAKSNEAANLESRFVGIPCSMFKETSTEKNSEAKGNECGGPRVQFQLSGMKNGCTKTYPGGRQKKQSETTNSENPCVNSGSETFTSLHRNIIVPETYGNSLSDKQNDPEKSNSSSSRGSGSTLHMLDLECTSRACIEKSECDASDRSKTKLQSDIPLRSIIKKLGEEKTAEDSQSQLQGASPITGVTSKLNHGSKINAQNQVPHSLLLSSSKAPMIENREPKNLRGNALQLNAKEISMQLKSTFRPAAAGSIHSPLSLSKAVHAFSGLKTDKLTSCPADEKRVSGSNDKGTLPTISISKPSGGKVQEQLLLGPRSDETQEDNMLPQDQSFSAPEEGSSYSTKQTGTPKAGFANNRLLKISSFEKHESSVNVDEKCLETKMIISGLKESNTNLIGGKPESSQAGNCDLKSEMTAALTSSSSANGKKCSPLNSPFKRKSVEAPNLEVFSLNPLKRLSGSMFPRRMLVATPISDDQQEPKQTINESEVLRASNEEPCSKDLLLGSRSSPGATTVQHVKDKEESMLSESDEYRKKAESYAKELDDICSILRKKNEEAKELLVHAVVNNNLLMMLNHPRHDEKIRSLQRFANILLARKYED